MVRNCLQLSLRQSIAIYLNGSMHYRYAIRASLSKFLFPFCCRPTGNIKFLSSLATPIAAKSLFDRSVYSSSHYLLSTANDSQVSSKDKTIKLSQRQKLKIAIRDYGAVVIVFHVGISLLSLGGIYLAVANGLDIVFLLQKLGFSDYATNSKVLLEGSTFVVAYGIHKVFAPVRIAITLSSAPFIVRYLRKVEILKSPKPK